MNTPLHVVLGCAESVLPKVRYVLDTLMCAAGVPVEYVTQPPADGPWLLYAGDSDNLPGRDRCLAIPHDGEAWRFFSEDRDIDATASADGLVVAVPPSRSFDQAWDIRFDVIASAFYFLSSWSERVGGGSGAERGLYARSVFRRLDVPQDVVDEYLARFRALLDALCERIGCARWPAREWPGGARYAVVLSHDVDFLPAGFGDMAVQGAKTFLRHLVRQRDPGDAVRSGYGLAKALLQGRDPFGCVPEIIAAERSLGVAASFQVAVGHRHPHDVNYHVEDPRTRDYLRAILDEGFELCLHGSYRSTEHPDWYVEEVGILEQHLGRPIGSRQHFLAFNYDALFRAQERAGIQYDMSMGYPDRVGPRAGFSFPYFPYCIQEDRPYRVLQISLFLMDVTLRGYMRLKRNGASPVITEELQALRRKGGCASVVWHPIVFGGARDPGYAELFWDMVREIGRTGGLATDGRTVNTHWRSSAGAYRSFSWAMKP